MCRHSSNVAPQFGLEALSHNKEGGQTVGGLSLPLDAGI